MIINCKKTEKKTIKCGRAVLIRQTETAFFGAKKGFRQGDFAAEKQRFRYDFYVFFREKTKKKNHIYVEKMLIKYEQNS